MAFRRSTDENADAEALDAPVEHVDGLTGLPDRWQLENWISQQLVRNRRTGDRFGMFLVSVCNLTEINSGYGSAVGDEVLQAVSEGLASAVGERGQLARYLGSEFAVLWPGLFGAEESNRVAKAIMSGLPQQVAFENFVVPVEIALAGVMSDPELSERLLLVDAESTLAEARSRQGTRVVVRDEAYGVRRKPDILAVKLQRAFDADEFQLYYQPIVSMTAGVVVGFEAVLRWLSPDAGPSGAELIQPGVFLDALRASPIVVPLHAWVLHKCAKEIATWSRRLETPSLFGATNLDPSFIRDERFVQVVKSVVEEAGLRPTQILLDLNANTTGLDLQTLWPSLQAVKAAGVGVALEDFGVGMGSPDLMRQARFDVIRLPRAIIKGLGLAEEDDIIARNLINLAHDLGCHVIAEGVETKAQAKVLRSVGCDLAQGSLFGRPAPASEVNRELDEIVKLARRAGPESKT
jgi:diguanylate cyclase (GGDEF)-like protein